MQYLFTSQLARQLGVAPRVISDLFYARVFDESRCPFQCGRRMIPLDYVPTIEAALRERGKLPAAAGAKS